MKEKSDYSNVWVIKGNKDNIQYDDRDGDIVDHMREEINENNNKDPCCWWIQRRKSIHKAFKAGDIVLAWRSRKKIGIVGIGEVIEVKPFGYTKPIDGEYPEPNEQWFNWRPVDCWVGRERESLADVYISLDEIRSALGVSDDLENFSNPSFTKACVIQTVYPVSVEHAWVLRRLITVKVGAPYIKPAAKKLLSQFVAPPRSRKMPSGKPDRRTDSAHHR